jgi:GAF domain-containing protein
MPRDKVADPLGTIADLQRELARCRAERDEALAQQTATAEVLQVINSSPGDLVPVFDAILEKAMHLCQAAFGVLWTYDSEYTHAVATRGVPLRFDEFLRQGPHQPARVVQRSIIDGAPYEQIADLSLTDEYRAGDPLPRAGADLGGVRTLLGVALRKNDNLLGVFGIYRQEVRPFTDKQIALLQNFAAQAVIAMENARLITETREALEQQTATAEVLQAINSSPGDLARVFDAMLDKALRLCGAGFGIMSMYDGERFHRAAARGIPVAFEEWRKANPLISRSGAAPTNIPTALKRLLAGEDVIQDTDLKNDEPYRNRDPNRCALVDLAGARSDIVVALRKDDALFGALTIFRQEVRPFSGRQVALLQNFAAQAVIAIENARLLTETREALEQQTATAEVLQVINSSPGDLAPVFDAMLEKALNLCDAACGGLQTYDGEYFRTVAARGHPQFDEWVRQQGASRGAPGSTMARMVQGERIVQIADIADTELSRTGIRRGLVEIGGFRTLLGVALRKDDILLGALQIYRQEVRPFTDKQIALLQNFAAQAVIAMENARLITGTREALEQQTATAEVLGVINSSPGDLAPVFDAILEKAHNLCEAAHGALTTYDGKHFRAVALHAMPEQFGKLLCQPFPPYAGGAHEPLLQGEPLVHIPDVRARHLTTPIQHASIDAGIRTLLMVPLRKDDTLLGYITAHRREVRPFTENQITLLQNFAAQAVIAMENARLIAETREALDQQTATAEVLGVINSSPGDLTPVFDAMLEKATSLCDAAYGTLFTYDGEGFNAVALRGVPAAFADTLTAPVQPAPGAALDRLVRGERFADCADIANEAAYGGPAGRAP